MILSLLDIYSKSCEESATDFPSAILSILFLFPESFIGLLGHSPFSQVKAKSLQKVNKTFFKGTNDTICTFVAKQASDSSNFSIAQTFSLLSSDIDLSLQILEKWTRESPSNEKAWFITRYVLLKIATGKSNEAQLVYNHYREKEAFSGSPNSLLSRFIHYLFRSIELESPEIFKAIDEKFGILLSVDLDLKELVERIGQQYFSIVKERPMNMMDMMSRMMGMQ